ncbi:MAG: hypothetical protein KBT46_07400 [Ruminococcus sp.]|nr:hypothetical protein [Candidatus Copronaster equi]
MKIIAHRCGTDKHQEQTISAARFSLENGVDYVEVDIRFTRDGKPVVIHDSTPEKLYGIKTPVSELDEKDFLSLRRACDKSVCGHSFKDYLECGIDRMLFHCKEGGEKLNIILDLCNKYDILDKVVFGVQSVEDVKLVKSFGDVKVLAFMPSATMISDFSDAGADYIRLWERWCNADNISKVKSTGKKLWIMSDSPVVGEISDGCYDFYKQCGADGILVNKILPAIDFYTK